MSEGNLRLSREGDVEEAAVADGPRAVEFVERGLGLDERRHVARVVGAGGVVDIPGERAVAERLGAAFPVGAHGVVCLGGREVLGGEGGDAVRIARHRRPTAPGFGGVGVDFAREAREVRGERAHEAVVAVPERAHDRRMAVVVIRPRDAGREHDEERQHHREAAERQDGIDDGEEDASLRRMPFACEQHAHVQFRSAGPCYWPAVKRAFEAKYGSLVKRQPRRRRPASSPGVTMCVMCTSQPLSSLSFSVAICAAGFVVQEIARPISASSRLSEV